MDITKQYQERQEAKQLQSRISSFIGEYQIGTLLNKSGIRKLKGGIAAAAVLGNFPVAI